MVHHETSLPLKGGGVAVFLFGDLQLGSQGFDDEAWEQFKQEFKSTPNAIGLGLGDYGDWLRPSMRSRVQGSISGDDSARSMMDDLVRSDQDKKGGVLDKMDFLKGRLIGLHSGHHEWEWGTGGNSTQRLCSALKAPYLGWMASTRLKLAYGALAKRTSKFTRTFAYTMVTMHGTGNGRFVGSDTNWMERNIVSAWDADFYARGHGCKAAAWHPFERNYVRTSGPCGVDKSTPDCMLIGGFNRSFTDGWQSSYAERAGFAPQPVSWGVLRIRRTQDIASANIKGLSGKKTRTLRVETLIRRPDRDV